MTSSVDLKVNLHQLLKAMIEKGASDMHITTGAPPLLRVDGSVLPLSLPALGPLLITETEPEVTVCSVIALLFRLVSPAPSRNSTVSFPDPVSRAVPGAMVMAALPGSR